jgi:hypothetical protein
MDERGWASLREFRPSRLPVDTPDMIRKDDAGQGRPLRQRHFKRIAFDLACDRADQRKAAATIVHDGGEYEAGPSAGLRIE